MLVNTKDFNKILNELADLVEFAERQEKEGLVDGSCDPHINIARSRKILDVFCPGWEGKQFCEAI